MPVDTRPFMAKSFQRPQSVDSTEPSRARDSQSFSTPSPGGDYDRARVATRAYELYMARGGADGGDLQDWLAAEREYHSSGSPEPSDQ